MPVTVKWDNPQQTIIHAVFNGKWDTDDLYRVIADGRSMADTVHHPVDSIYEFTRSASSPTSALAIVQGLDLWRSANERLVIIVNADGYIKTMCNIGRKLAPKTFEHMRFVENLREAYKTIAKQVATPML